MGWRRQLSEHIHIDAVAMIAIIWAAAIWTMEIPQRRAEAVNSAWQAINATRNAQGGNGGRIEALQRLADDNISLKGLSVQNAYLEAINLSNGDLQMANFSGAQLTAATFETARLDHAIFKQARLQQVRFNGARARYASFDSSFLNQADFTPYKQFECLRRIVPSPTPTRITSNGPDDYDNKWNQVELYTPAGERETTGPHGTNLYNASFAKASLQRTKFCGSYLYQSKFDGADASGAQFSGAAARYASFRGAVLETAQFIDADLTHADFTSACLLGADFSGAQLAGAMFDGARMGLDPNYLKTSFDGARMDEELRSIAQEVGYMQTSQFQPKDNLVVAFDIEIYHRKQNLHHLNQKRLKIGSDLAEGPPSCPSVKQVPVAEDAAGEY